MTDDNIQNLQDLVQKYTGTTKKIVTSDVKRLTAPGENYLGIVLKVEAILSNVEGKEESFNAVAKCLNFGVNEAFRKFIPIQYKKENSFYTEILPTLQEFVKESAVELNFMDIFPKLYASRSGLDESNDEPDENAVLLFENLNVQGFRNLDRTVGFAVDDAKVVLKDLAAFHAVPIALKLKKPRVFETKIKKHLYRAFAGGSMPPPPPDKKPPEDTWLEILEEFDEVKPYFKQLSKKLKANQEIFKEFNNRVPSEPFATVSHTDLWTNNTMQKTANGKVIKNKLIDFQLFAYATPADDLIFFLWSSIQLPFIRKEFDNLVKFYYNAFVDILDKFGCDTTQFTYENLLKEIDETAPKTFLQILFMLLPIFGKKGEAAFDVNEGPVNLKKESFTEATKTRAVQLVEDFGQRGWL